MLVSVLDTAVSVSVLQIKEAKLGMGSCGRVLLLVQSCIIILAVVPEFIQYFQKAC